MKKRCLILASMMFMPVHGEIEDHLVFKIGMDGKSYWYEHGVVQGAFGDPKNIVDEIYHEERGREIYDPTSDGWYWLDAIYNGAKATDKEVWMPYVFQDETPGSTQGKWVRYNPYGKMIKGWHSIEGSDILLYPGQAFNRYYYDLVTGEMCKGKHIINGTAYEFDETTGALKANTTNWRKAYNDKVVDLVASWTFSHDFLAASHAGIVYLDNDAIPEMYISFLDEPSGESHSELYTFDGTEVVFLGTFDKSPISAKGDWPITGNMSYNEGENLFTYNSRKEINDATIVHDYLSCLENSSIKVLSVGSYSVDHVKGQASNYTLDGLPVSSETYLEAFPSLNISAYEGDICEHFFVPDDTLIKPGIFATDDNSVILTLGEDGTYTMEESTSFKRIGKYIVGGYTWFEKTSVDEYTDNIVHAIRIYLDQTYFIAHDNDTIIYGTMSMKRIE